MANNHCFFLLLSCNSHDNNSRHIYNKPPISFDEASRSVVKFKSDILRLQKILNKSIKDNNTILQISINKMLGEAHEINADYTSTMFHKYKYLTLAQEIINPIQELMHKIVWVSTTLK